MHTWPNITFTDSKSFRCDIRIHISNCAARHYENLPMTKIRKLLRNQANTLYLLLIPNAQMHYQVDIHLSSVESPGTLKIHQVNLSRRTCFSSNFTPASLCRCNHTTMAAVCSMTLGKVTGDLRDVAGLILASKTHYKVVLHFSPFNHM